MRHATPTRQSAHPSVYWSNNCSSTPRITRHTLNKLNTSATAPGGSLTTPFLRPNGVKAVAFLAGQYMADKCHKDRAKAIAKEQSDEDEASRLTQPE